MSSPDFAPCPSCGTPHRPDARYCVRCGTLVGARSIDLDRAFDAAREREDASATAVEPDGGVPARTAVWRRPAASILTTAALAAGVLGGFLLGPDHGAAQRGPVLLGGLGTAAAPAATTATAAGPSAADDTATTAPPAVEGDADVPAAADTTSTAAGDDTSSAAADDTSTSTSAGGDDTSSGDTSASDDTTTSDDTTDGGDKNLGGLAKKATGLPPITNVWVIGVSGQDYPALFGTADGYLSGALASRGTVLPNYTPAAGGPLAGAMALLSGQAPTAATPTDVPTLAGQLTAASKTWRAYVEGAGATGCAPPADPGTARNPFAFFTTITGAADCASDVVDLSNLTTDLGAADSIPAFSYIVLDPSHDGGGPSGTAGLDAFLQTVVAPIRRTDAYQSGGLIAIVPTAGAPGSTAPTGALLLSPFAARNIADDTALGPYALLRTIEDAFSLDHLGHAADGGVKALGAGVLG
jgi:hypothetical protein